MNHTVAALGRRGAIIIAGSVGPVVDAVITILGAVLHTIAAEATALAVCHTLSVGFGRIGAGGVIGTVVAFFSVGSLYAAVPTARRKLAARGATGRGPVFVSVAAIVALFAITLHTVATVGPPFTFGGATIVGGIVVGA